MNENTRKNICRGALFCFGGSGYGLMETLFRGYTHISMLIAGGLCLCILVGISKTKFRLFTKVILGTLCITTVEFAIGCIVNLWLGLGVWDYSDEPFHLLGQICPRFTLIWSLFSTMVIPLHKFFTEPVRTRHRSSLQREFSR